MNYQYLGKLPEETISFFRDELLKRKKPNMPYQWISFDNYLNTEFMKLFENTELQVQWIRRGAAGVLPVQKAFYSESGYGFRIHKDGISCRSALNISISCNKDDWVRWYDENHINSIGNLEITDKTFNKSRNVDIFEYEDIPFIEEHRNEIGDVYLVNTDVYHSFKCNGDNPRIVIQTKFEGFPYFDMIRESLMKSSFTNIIRG